MVDLFIAAGLPAKLVKRVGFLRFAETRAHQQTLLQLNTPR